MKRAFILCLALLSANLYSKASLKEVKKLESPLPIMIVADNQFTNLLAYPHLFRTKMIDKYVQGVAIRPPQLDLFSRDLFQWTLNKHSTDKYIVHLGDALNLGCKNEWNVFKTVMASQRGNTRGWVMAPGNHDFYAYGNSSGSRLFPKSNFKNFWEKICQTDFPVKKAKKYKTHILSKDIFIDYYLNEIEQQDFGFKRKDMDCKVKESKKGIHYEPKTKVKVCQWKATKESDFLQRVYTVVPTLNDLRVTYKSLILQELNLGKGVKAILMDSTDYPQSPVLVAGIVNKKNKAIFTTSNNAGVVGYFQERQFDVIKSWMKQSKNHSYLLMAHHSKKNLVSKASKRLDKLAIEFPNSLYVSAHTHEGFDKEWKHHHELNIGSMTDFKPQYLYMGKSKSGDFEYVRNNITIKDINDPYNCSEKHNLTGKDFGYASYKKAKNGMRKMYDYTLFSLERSLKQVFETIFPDGLARSVKEDSPVYCRSRKCKQSKLNKVKLLLDLDQRILRNDLYLDERLRFGACQTIWAGEAEKRLYNIGLQP